jgi:hypothetical protein
MRTGLMGLLLLFAVPVAMAGTTTLNAVASGFYSQNGTQGPDGYAVGWYTNSIPNNVELRDYFTFDTSGVTGTVTGAVLRLSTAPNGFIRYGSSDPSETYTLFDVSTGIPGLTGGTGGMSAFTDLGTGAAFGSFDATAALGPTVDIPLNPAGVAYLDANRGLVALGGAITTLVKGATSEFLFNSTNASLTRQLLITTSEAQPIPSASIPALGSGGFAILTLCLLAAFYLETRRRRANS